MASKTSTQTAAPAAKAKAIKTKLRVTQDTGRGSVPRQRTYEVSNRETGDVLGIVVEIWSDGQMGGDAYKNSVTDGRRKLSAATAKGKELGSEFTSRARAVAAVRIAAQA